MKIKCRNCGKKVEKPKDRLLPEGWIGTFDLKYTRQTYLCPKCRRGKP